MTSEVFLLENAQGQRAVGKCVLPGLPDRCRELLKHEYVSLSRFAHPAVARVLAITEHESASWLILEHLEYGDLRSLAGAPLVKWLPLLLQPSRWLARCHSEGFVHGDIKTRHLMLRKPGQACFIDLATMSAVGESLPMATPAVVPPEGVTSVSPATDVFAFGVMLHELLFAGLPGINQSMPDPVLPDGQLAALAVACRAVEPNERPTMLVVFAQLLEVYGRIGDQSVAPV